MWDEAGRLTEWLADIPVEAQLLKLSEEVGEVAEAYLGLTGLNPRKGITHTRDDLVHEVADVMITAAVTIVRLSGSPGAAQAAFETHLASVLTRAGLATPPPETPAAPDGRPGHPAGGR